MVKSSESSLSLRTSRDKRWPYDEYYFGDRDGEDRKNGQGENHWTGAESLEWYIGPMLRDTMHGQGDYRWRYKDPDGSFVTYEGQFFANQMHGYGVMSYPDGRVFVGLYYKNVRWGPGVERTTCLHANVGFWRGTKLARLNWRPDGPSIAPNLATGNLGPAFLDSYRIVLKKHTKIIGQTNSALEHLKHYGADPIQATEKWMKLYPKYCTDMDSLLCQTDLFDKTYYKGKVKYLSESQYLDEVNSQDDYNSYEDNKNNEEIEPDIPSYFAWNNSEIMMHMMKHCYQHERQRARIKLNLEGILNGPRWKFRPASKHENDCRSLLLSSYTGNIINVTQLVNEEDVFPDISDNLGNTALMYAACGDQFVVIHFLVEAGANVDAFNDSCCTPLGVALMRYACIASDVPRSAIVNTLLPQIKKDKTTTPKKEKTSPEIDQIKAAEWIIIREAMEAKPQIEQDLKKFMSMKKIKSSVPAMKKSAESTNHEKRYDSDDDIFSDEKKLFLRANGEFNEKISSQFMGPVKGNTDGYLFATCDMAKEVDAAQEEMIKALTEKQPAKSAAKGKATKDSLPKGSVFKVQSVFTAGGSQTSLDKEKMEVLSKIQLTILQLLADGADPKLVKCPQPAILLATKSGNPELVKNLVTYGADINQKFPDLQDYTVLDMVISESFSTNNLELIRTLLEIGADTQHRLKFEDPNRVPDQDLEVPIVLGPTLLHAVVLKKTEFEFEEDIRNTAIQLLLQYNADPTAQYKGHSAIDCAMLKKLRLLEPFILHPGTNLNAIINENNQTILVKLFSKDYFKSLLGVEKIPTLTNLLLYGADPLIECFDGDVRYGNMFEFAQKVLKEIAPAPLQVERKLSTQPSETKEKGKAKLGADKKSKSKSKIALQPVEDSKKKDKGLIEAVEYKECLGMMRECARLLHVRWLQAKLLKELINVIQKFKHRHWTMIIREHKNGHRVGLWVSTSRCIEIWNILETTNKKKYKDKKILRTLLRIIQFYQKRLKAQLEITPYMTATEKNIIETDVGLLMREHRIASHLSKEAEAWKRPYVKPELIYKGHKKFQVCFECCLRLQEDKMTCDFCGLVSFCNYSCMNTNIERTSGHPCSEKLKEKYTMLAEDHDNTTADATMT